MPTVDRGDYRIHYEVSGPADGPPLLLVMGLALSSAAWESLPDRLADRFRVIRFDNRGTGGSTNARGLYSIAAMADDAAAVLDAVAVRRAHVFGVSMGGMISLELVLRHPERVERLALGATFAGWLRSRKPRVSTLVDLLKVNAGARRDLRPALRMLMSEGWVQDNRERAERWMRRSGHAGLLLALRQMVAIARHATHRRLAQIQAPTLILTGDSDLLVPADNSFQLQRMIPGARLIVLPGAGHVFPLEREAETVQALTAHFLG